MNARKETSYGTLLILFCLSLFLVLNGCSSPGSSFRFFGRGEGRENPQKVSRKDLSGFFSKMRVHRGNPESHYLLACHYQERERHNDALKEFSKTLLIDPEHVQALNGMGVSYDRLRNFSRATESYRAALKINPNLDYVQNNLGYSFLLQGKYEAAIDAFKNAASLNGKKSRIQNNLAMAYAMAGSYDQALATFKSAGDQVKANYYLARVYYKKGLYAEAGKHFAEALSLDPSLRDAREGVEASEALIAGTASRGQEIREDFAGDDKADPPRPSEINMRQIRAAQEKARFEYITASAYYQKNMFAEAGEHYRKVLCLDPSSTEARKGLAAASTLARIMAANDRSARAETACGRSASGVLAAGDFSKVRKGSGVEVSNGNGVRHMARNLGVYLTANGYRVVRLTNAPHFNYSEGRIYYTKDYLVMAQEIATLLPRIPDMQQVESFGRPDIKVKVRIGKDFVPVKMFAGVL